MKRGRLQLSFKMIVLFIFQSYPAVLTLLLSKKRHTSIHLQTYKACKRLLMPLSAPLLAIDHISSVTLRSFRALITSLSLQLLYRDPLSLGCIIYFIHYLQQSAQCFMQPSCYLVGHKREGRAHRQNCALNSYKTGDALSPERRCRRIPLWMQRFHVPCRCVLFLTIICVQKQRGVWFELARCWTEVYFESLFGGQTCVRGGVM